MTRLAGTLALIVLVHAAGGAAVALRAQGQAAASSSPAVETMFADASAKEAAVRKVLITSSPPATLLKAVRTVVADFEGIVRRYPSSAYCDDALWHAAKLAGDAFEAFGDPQEQATAVRLFQMLASQYPSSRFVRLTAPQIAALSAMTPKPTSVPEPAVVTPPARPGAAPAPAAPSPPALAPEGDRAPAGRLAVIKDIRRASLSDIVRIVIELDREVAFRDERIENPDRVFVDLAGTDAARGLRDQTIRFEADSDLVRQVRLGRHPNNTTRVVLDAGGVSSYSVYPLYNPFRLVIDCLRSRPADAIGQLSAFPPLRSTPALLLPKRIEPWTRTLPSSIPIDSAALRASGDEASAPAAPDAAPVTPASVASLPAAPAITGQPSRTLAGGFSIARQLGLGVSRIVIDPGHGGHDPGAKGDGTTEAELVLDVALRLEKLLAKAPGIEVVLTRRTDAYVPLQERTAIANRENADLFLSIHANANSVASVRGVETYFLNFATNLSTAAVAARENAASGQSMGALPDVVKTIALNNKLDESRDFATYVQREMMAKLRPSYKTIRDLGVKQAPFVVLIGAAMPSILTEISFMTNPQDARLLKSGVYRQRIAEALFGAVRKYQASLRNVSTLAEKPGE